MVSDEDDRKVVETVVVGVVVIVDSVVGGVED